MYKGDYAAGATVHIYFNTRDTDGAPITLASGTVRVYKGASTTEDDSGITLTADLDGRVGFHHVAIDTSTDGTFYSAASDFAVVLTVGTVDSVSVVGVIVGEFSIENRSALRPTTAGRTLDVSAGGEAGVDWANVGSPTTALNLSGTTVKTATDVETDTADIQARLPAALVSGRIDASVGAMAANVMTAAAAAADLTTELQSGLATAAAVSALNNLSAAQVNAEVVDALNVDTYAEPGQESPPATTTLVKKIGYLYKMMRNRRTQTATEFKLYADDATTVDQKATVADDGTTASITELATGP